MKVSELIDLVAQLSFGRNMPTIKERENYLRFLNLANLELWQIAVNADIFFETKDIFFEADSNTTPVPDGYYIKALFDGKKRLIKCKVTDIFEMNQSQYAITNNTIITNIQKNTVIKLDPIDSKEKNYLTAILLPNSKRLVENVNDAKLECDKPVYPEPYHLGLVHGALFYLYLSGKGFSEKIKYQILGWDEAKKSLREYYSH